LVLPSGESKIERKKGTRKTGNSTPVLEKRTLADRSTMDLPGIFLWARPDDWKDSRKNGGKMRKKKRLLNQSVLSRSRGGRKECKAASWKSCGEGRQGKECKKEKRTRPGTKTWDGPTPNNEGGDAVIKDGLIWRYDRSASQG